MADEQIDWARKLHNAVEQVLNKKTIEASDLMGVAVSYHIAFAKLLKERDDALVA